MKWATRRHCHVDRVACAWLIQRFIDPAPQFVLVDDPDEVADDATPFDLRGVELGHRHGGCSFESFLRRHDLVEPALLDIGRIVHEADIGDDLYDAPEGPGLDVVVRRSHLHEEPTA